MEIRLRVGQPDDAEACARIFYEAFSDIGRKHGLELGGPGPEAGIARARRELTSPGFYSIVAECDGRVVGSNFLDERSVISGIGPITVEPAVQNGRIGRQLMEDALAHASNRGAVGVRLMQACINTSSFALYTKLGFVARMTAAAMEGPPINVAVTGTSVRKAVPADLTACNEVCFRVHGHDRSGEVGEAIADGTVVVVERQDRITGYTTKMAGRGHSVGETNDDLRALICSREPQDQGFFVPTDNSELLRWCLEHGLRMTRLMTLMTIGLYNEPAGAYIPSILY
jgi:predicted N-acetyltransferase YhbS